MSAFDTPRRRDRLRPAWLWLGLGLLACGKTGSGSGASGLPSGAVVVPGSAVAVAAPTKVVLPGGVTAPGSFADLAERADPAVVFIRTLQEKQQRVVGAGLGSAFVYQADGLILTNNHVIENASAIQVIFANPKRELPATVVGRDGPTDVAVLRVKAKNLPHLPLGDSDALRVGDWVVAIGNPFGLSHTVSAGIISAKGRTRNDVKGLDDTGYYSFLQTDAGINPGNSGGPLLNMAGQVVGINTAIRARANSIGFAIPIKMVKELIPRLIKDGKIVRSAIGIIVAGVTSEDVKRLGLKDGAGALVRRVLPGGPAGKAGLAEDDVIVGFEGKRIPGPERLRWLASIAGVGSQVNVRVRRGKRSFSLKLTLGVLEAPTTPSP